MKIITWEELNDKSAYPENIFENRHKGSTLTVGVFDGVHLGHSALLGEIVSAFPGTIPCVVTFKNNPSRFFNPHNYRGDILTLQQKIEALEKTGIGIVILIDFSSDFSKLTGKQFLSILLGRISPVFIALGKDFVCGHNGDTDADAVRTMMKQQGIPVAIIPPILYKGSILSSTRIREAVHIGDFGTVKAMLGRNYSLDLRGLEINRSGKGAVIKNDILQQVIPDSGEYPVLIKGMERCEKGSVLFEERCMQYWPDIDQPVQIEFTD